MNSESPTNVYKPSLLIGTPNHIPIPDTLSSGQGFFGPVRQDWPHMEEQVCDTCTMGFGSPAILCPKRLSDDWH